MKLLGVELHRPTFNDLSLAALIAAVLWAAVQLSPFGEPTGLEASARLIAIFSGAVSYKMGVDIHKGWRHLVLCIAACVSGVFVWSIAACIWITATR